MVVLQKSLRKGSPDRIQGEAFRYAAHSLDSGGNPSRWPLQGWNEGDADSLADIIERPTLSERRRRVEKVVPEPPLPGS